MWCQNKIEMIGGGTSVLIDYLISNINYFSM